MSLKSGGFTKLVFEEVNRGGGGQNWNETSKKWMTDFLNWIESLKKKKRMMGFQNQMESSKNKMKCVWNRIGFFDKVNDGGFEIQYWERYFFKYRVLE